MFDIGATELLLIVVVAILVIGPKDMPLAMRSAGRWIGKARRVSAHFRTGVDAMVREAEMEDMEKEWKDRNAKIMAETPSGEMQPLAESEAGAEVRLEADSLGLDGAGPDGAAGEMDAAQVSSDSSEPELPLDPDMKK